jgi:hypothetical protein
MFKSKITWIFLTLLAGFILFFQLKEVIPPGDAVFAPNPVLQNFQICLTKLILRQNSSPSAYRPKTCEEADPATAFVFSDSKIIYKNDRVIGMQGKNRKDGKWYQVDTTDESVIRVVSYEP